MPLSCRLIKYLFSVAEENDVFLVKCSMKILHCQLFQLLSFFIFLEFPNFIPHN